MGLGFAAGGLFAAFATLAVDMLKAGDFAGIGPLQQIALIGAGILLVTGLTLIPLGNRPA